MGSYLILILALGVFGWVQRGLIMHTSLPLDSRANQLCQLVQRSSLYGVGLYYFRTVHVGQRLLTDLPKIQPSIYRRIIDLILACLLSVAFTSMLDLNLPLFGFYLAVMSVLVLFDLFNESGNKSVIWVICWRHADRRI